MSLNGLYLTIFLYDPNYPYTTTTINNEGNPGVNDPENYGYDEHDNDEDES